MVIKIQIPCNPVLTEVIGTHGPPRTFPCPAHYRQEQAREQADDDYDHKKLD